MAWDKDGSVLKQSETLKSAIDNKRCRGGYEYDDVKIRIEATW